MNKKDLLKKLNFFYALELNQTKLYTSLTGKFTDKYKSQVLKHIACIEQQHADSIGEIIKELGGNPQSATSILAPATGTMAGALLSLTDRKKICQGLVLLEEKAMEDYQRLIISLPETPENKKLLKILEKNLIDEDLHKAWCKENL